MQTSEKLPHFLKKVLQWFRDLKSYFVFYIGHAFYFIRLVQ